MAQANTQGHTLRGARLAHKLKQPAQSHIGCATRLSNDPRFSDVRIAPVDLLQ